MNWLNPVNWIKSGIASSADKAIDENVTLPKAKEVTLAGLNKVIGLTESKVNDEKLRAYADGFVKAGNALVHLGNGIHPDGKGGRNLTLEELDEIYGDIDAAFGSLVGEEKLAEVRGKLKAFVRTKLGLD